MLAVFLELVKRVGIFMIIGQTILHLGIGKEYEKYMKLVISFMVAAQVVFAFEAYFQKSGSHTWTWREEEYYENWNRNMKVLEEEFDKKQSVVGINLEQRIGKQEAMIHEEESNKDNRIKIEKIVVQ